MPFQKLKGPSLIDLPMMEAMGMVTREGPNVFNFVHPPPPQAMGPNIFNFVHPPPPQAMEEEEESEHI